MIEPLTPTPGGQPVRVRWPDEDGPFLLTVHLARVDGRTVMTGLDVGQADPGRPAEVNHPVLRGLQAGRIAEAGRLRLAVLLAGEGTVEALARLASLTAPDAARAAGGRAAGGSLLRVAELWRANVAAGGDRARRPAVHVHAALVAAGEDVTLGAVRARLHRARVAGLLERRQPPT